MDEKLLESLQPLKLNASGIDCVKIALCGHTLDAYWTRLALAIGTLRI